MLCAPSFATLALLAGCDQPTYVSEQGQLGIDDADLVVPAVYDREAPAEVVAGTRMCPDLAGWYADDGDYQTSPEQGDGDDDWLRGCFTLGSQGASSVPEGCFAFDDPGPAAITFTPRACQAVPDADFVDDRLAIVVHDLARIELRYDDIMRWLGESASPGPADAFPAVPPEPAAGMRVIADNHLRLDLRPFDGEVALAYGGAALALTGPQVPASTGVPPGSITTTPALGDAFAATLALASGTLTGPDIVVVEASEARSLTLAVAYAPCEDCDEGYTTPLLAVPLVADAAGNRLHGADVSWSSDNPDLGFAVDEAGRVDEGPNDVVTIDACRMRDGKRHEATLSAQFEGLTATAVVRYDCSEPASSSGCACDLSDDRPTITPLLAGLVLAWFGRRRRGSARLGRATRSELIAS